MKSFLWIPLAGGLILWPLSVVAQLYPGSANLTTTQVTVGATATAIVAAHPGRAEILIVNNGSVAVYVGPTASVTTTTGLLIPPSATVPFPIPYQGALYGITASSQVISVAEVF